MLSFWLRVIISNFRFFDEQLKKKLGLPYKLGADSSEEFGLYRQTVSLEVPNIGFNGYRITLVTTKSYEVTAHYLSDYFQKKLANYPKTLKARKEEFAREAKWLRTLYTHRGLMFWAPYNQTACDVLIQEMGLPVTRTNNFWDEYFMPMTSYRYANLRQQRRDRDAGKRVTQFYIGFFNLVFVFFVIVALIGYYLLF